MKLSAQAPKFVLLASLNAPTILVYQGLTTITSALLKSCPSARENFLMVQLSSI